MSARSELDRGQLPEASAARPSGSPIPFVRANALDPFVSFLNTIGAPVERLLRHAHVPPTLLDDSEALLPVISAYRFAELAARQEQIEDLGVVIGQRASAFDLGVYGAVLQGASTVYEYLKLGVRLIGGHSTGTRLWLTPEGGMLRVNQHLTGPPGPGRCIADLYTLVLTINTLRKLVGPSWDPGEVRLLAGDEVLLGDRGFLGNASVITGQRHTSFTISRSIMQLPVPCSPTRSRPGDGSRLAESWPMPADLMTSVEQLILSLLHDGYPSIQTTSDAAGVSSRTLQRRLAEAGVTYRGLVAAGRLRLAKVWLADSDMPVSEIATTLGYDEPSNFTRAFRRQTGVSPTVFRRGRLQN